MRCVIPLLLAACACAGDAYEKTVAVEVYALGVSYHSNRDIDWNEANYGLGIGLAVREPSSTIEAVVMAATYRDSFDEQAYLFQMGARKTFGDFDELHGTIGATVGYLRGSGNNGMAIIPMASVGYDWLDLCVTYMPAVDPGADYNGTDPKDNRKVGTSVVAVFVKLRLCEF